MTHPTHSLAPLSRLFGSALFVLLLTGFMPGDCGGGEDPPPNRPCTIELACDEGFHCEMVDVLCFRAPCEAIPQCVPDEEPPPPPQECWFDEDCPTGFYCEYEYPEVQPGETRPEFCMPAPTGTCQPIEEPSGCESDSDCAADEECVFYEVELLCEECAGDLGCTQAVCSTRTEGVCEPIESCTSDADCGPDGYCEHYATCAAIGCPPPPPSRCVYPEPTCGDVVCPEGTHCEVIAYDCLAGGDSEDGTPPPDCGGTSYTCVPDEEPPPPPTECSEDAHCGPGETCQLVELCYDCTDEGACPMPACQLVGHCEPTPTECWGAWVDEAGVCRSPNDGVYPDSCCRWGCTSDADCGPGGTCWDGMCAIEPVCPDASDPRVTYMSTEPETCMVIDFVCPANNTYFGGDCGCGCIALDACEGLTEYECHADPLCDPVYGPSYCTPDGVCTTDTGYQGCQTTPF